MSSVRVLVCVVRAPQSPWMTSAADGWAGEQRGTSDHGLPSLLNRVSEQTAPTHPAGKWG